MKVSSVGIVNTALALKVVIFVLFFEHSGTFIDNNNWQWQLDKTIMAFSSFLHHVKAFWIFDYHNFCSNYTFY